jgi:hypothetical protein
MNWLSCGVLAGAWCGPRPGETVADGLIGMVLAFGSGALISRISFELALCGCARCAGGIARRVSHPTRAGVSGCGGIMPAGALSDPRVAGGVPSGAVCEVEICERNKIEMIFERGC